MLVLVVGAVVGGGVYYHHYVTTEAETAPYRTEKVTRGDLHITVSATGTIEPEEVVDIGAQVVGRIKELGKDPRGRTDPKYADKSVDYGSPVEKGMVLAQIDPAIYAAQMQQATATLAQAQANVAQMQAQVEQTQAEWERAQKLNELRIPTRSPTGDANIEQGLPIKGISDADYVLAEANAKSAEANLKAAKAMVLQAQATLELAKTNLKYTTIESPIGGTIIDRRVNIGQTVVSSLNAPSLFLIARDLRRMQVWASVNEADIARLKPGTKVHFQVDAYPENVFYGTVVQIRLNASMTQNVVTYTVVISVDNSDLKLLPYLTADVKFEVEDRTNVLLVPNSALRFLPTAEQIESEAPDEGSESTEDSVARSEQTKNEADESAGRVWQVVPGTTDVRPIDVRTGLSDGAFTEITGGDLHEGDEVVVGGQQQVASSDVNNPFSPVRFRRRRPPAKNAD